MTLIDSKAYPDSETYRGMAKLGTIVFNTPRTGLEPMEWFAQKLISTSEYIVNREGGRMLEIFIWAEPKTWYGIPYYEWTMGVYFYYPETLSVPETLFEPTTMTILAIAVSAISICGVIYSLRQAINDIRFGPAEIDPETGKPVRNKRGVFDVLPVMALIIFGFSALKIYREYIKTQKMKTI